MNKVAIIFISILLAMGFSAYYYSKGSEYIVRIPEETLQKKISENLPLTKNYLIIFDVTFSNPRINLENGSNRIHAGLDVTLNIILKNQPKPLGGSIDISSGLKYDSNLGELFLNDPIIEKFNIQGIPDIYTKSANSAITKALIEYYAKNPVYTLSAMDTKEAVAKLILKNVVVKNKGLEVILGI